MFRKQYREAGYAKGSGGPNKSKHDCLKQLIQNMPVNGMDRNISSDHTDDTAKNFAKEEGEPKAMKHWAIVTGMRL